MCVTTVSARFVFPFKFRCNLELLNRNENRFERFVLIIVKTTAAGVVATTTAAAASCYNCITTTATNEY